MGVKGGMLKDDADMSKLGMKARLPASVVMAYIDMAYMVMAHIVMAFVVMACVVMAYIRMAYCSDGLQVLAYI